MQAADGLTAALIMASLSILLFYKDSVLFNNSLQACSNGCLQQCRNPNLCVDLSVDLSID